MKQAIFIVGPTAIGKTKTAIDLCKYLKTEIISADSRQIYKEISIGTAKPSKIELNEAVHHCIATKSINDYYNASMFEVEALDVLNSLFVKYETVVVVGGSGLYIDALLFGIDDLPTIEPEIRNQLQKQLDSEGIESLRLMLKHLDSVSYEKIDLQNHKRILKCLEISIQTGRPYSSFLTGNRKKRDFEYKIFMLDQNREMLYNSINQRVDLMIEQGLVDEAKSLIDFKHLTPLQTIGYREIFDYLDRKTDLEEAIDLIKRHTRKYARKQLSWFRRYEDRIEIIDENNNFFPKILDYL